MLQKLKTVCGHYQRSIALRSFGQQNNEKPQSKLFKTRQTNKQNKPSFLNQQPVQNVQKAEVSEKEKNSQVQQVQRRREQKKRRSQQQEEITDQTDNEVVTEEFDWKVHETTINNTQAAQKASTKQLIQEILSKKTPNFQKPQALSLREWENVAGFLTTVEVKNRNQFIAYLNKQDFFKQIQQYPEPNAEVWADYYKKLEQQANEARNIAKAQIEEAQKNYDLAVQKAKEPQTALFQKDQANKSELSEEEFDEETKAHLLNLQGKIDQAKKNYGQVLHSNDAKGWQSGKDNEDLTSAQKKDAERLEEEWDQLHNLQIKRLTQHLKEFERDQQQSNIVTQTLKANLKKDPFAFLRTDKPLTQEIQLLRKQHLAFLKRTNTSQNLNELSNYQNKPKSQIDEEVDKFMRQNEVQTYQHQQHFIEFDNQRANAFRLFYLHQVNKGVSHTTALRRSLEQFRSDSIYVQSHETISSETLRSQSKYFPSLYPFPEESEGRWQIDPVIKNQLQFEEQSVVEEQKIEQFNEKYLQLLHKFQDVQVEVVDQFINQRSIELARRDDHQLGLQKPLQIQIQQLTEEDLQIKQHQYENIIHQVIPNMTQNELASIVTQVTDLTSDQAMQIAQKIKTTDFSVKQAEVDLNAFKEFQSALETELSQYGAINSLDDLKKELLANLPEEVRIDPAQLEELSKNSSPFENTIKEAIETQPKTIEKFEYSEEDKQIAELVGEQFKASLFNKEVPQPLEIAPQKNEIDFQNYPTEQQLMQDGEKLSEDQIAQLDPEQVAQLLESNITQENIQDLNQLINDINRGLQADGELHKEIERRYQKIFIEGLAEMGIPQSQLPIELTQILKLLESKSYEDIYKYLREHHNQQIEQVRNDEAYKRDPSLADLEAQEAEQGDPMEIIQKMSEIIQEQSQNQNVMINVDDPQQLAMFQVLNKIQDSDKLTREDIDWVVKHLETADPQNNIILKAHEIGMDGSASPVYDVEQKLRQHKLNEVKWDLFRLTQEMNETQVSKGKHQGFNESQTKAIEKLGLNEMQRFQILCKDIQKQAGPDSPILNNIANLVQAVASPLTEAIINEQVQNLVNLAKYNNKFNFIESHLRQLARCMVEGGFKTQLAARNLEVILNTEIAIERKCEQKVVEEQEEYPLHHNLIAQPDFQFKSAGQKLKEIDDYRQMQRQLQLTRFYRDQMANSNLSEKHKLVSSFDNLTDMLQKLDMGQKQDIHELPVFRRLNQTAQMTNHLISEAFEKNFGIKNITYNNVEQVYNQHHTGIPTLSLTKERLIENGMSDFSAQNLLNRYLNRLEDTCQIYSVLDFITQQDAKKHLNEAKPSQIHTNYRRRSSYASFAPLSRAGPLRPQKMSGVRLFSQVFQDVRVNQSKLVMATETQSSQVQSKSKFKQFVDSVEAIDEEVAKEELAFDNQNIDISFQGESTKNTIANLFADDEESPFAKISEEQQKRNEKDEAILKAKSKYDRTFFQRFMYSGKNSSQLTQKALEQYISQEEDLENLRMFSLALINSAYELNDQIPNIEMMFYKMFFSPITTAKERQGATDLLEGNIFAKEGINLPAQVYESLLETMILYPKKKHFKKIIQHIIRFNDRDNISGELLSLITNIGIDHQYPILMGQTMKYFVQNNYQVPEKTFKAFVLFLERSRGFEEDAKRFVIMSADSSHLTINYELLRPIFLRSIQNKTGQDVLKLFEQFRKNLKLNQSWKDKEQQDKNKQLELLKCDIYDGLISDLLQVQAHQLAQVIYTEKLKEKFDLTIKDHLTGMEIFAVQKLLTDFQSKFKEVFQQNVGNYTIDLFVCEEMARMLQYFNSQDTTEARLEMMDQIYLKLKDEQIKMSANLFDSLVFVYTEGQQWQSLKTLLEWSNNQNCEPEVKTVQYIKKNLLYCFDANYRALLKEKLEAFEQEFFIGKSNTQPQKNIAQNEARNQ